MFFLPERRAIKQKAKKKLIHIFLNPAACMHMFATRVPRAQVVLAAVQQDGRALWRASEALRSDRDVVRKLTHAQQFYFLRLTKNTQHLCKDQVPGTRYLGSWDPSIRIGLSIYQIFSKCLF